MNLGRFGKGVIHEFVQVRPVTLGIGGVQNQVIVVGQEAKPMNLPVALLARLDQGLDEVMPVQVTAEDVLTSVPTAHDVINGATVLDSEFAGHGQTFSAMPRPVKRRQRAFLRSEPVPMLDPREAPGGHSDSSWEKDGRWPQ